MTVVVVTLPGTGRGGVTSPISSSARVKAPPKALDILFDDWMEAPRKERSQPPLIWSPVSMKHLSGPGPP